MKGKFRFDVLFAEMSITSFQRVFEGLFLCLVAVAMASCGGDGESSAGSAPKSLANVEVTKVTRLEFSDRVEALGTVRALEATNISTNVTERVAEIFFEDGQSVKKGDLLVRLEDTEEKAFLEAAKSNQAEQEREIQRLGSLVRAGAVSDVRLKQYQTQKDVAGRRVEEADAKLADLNIKAPFDGVLGFRQISPGALVEPGDIIATLDVLDPVKLDFTVPETFLSSLTRGLKINTTTEAYPNETFTGEVVQIDTRVNPVTRSITVRAHIPNPDHRLRPGMLMTTVLENNPSNSRSVPERALVSVQKNNYIFVVNTSTDPPTVARTSVEIGRRIPGYVEIKEGLKEDDTVVTDGLIGLVDGAEVKISGEFSSPADPYQPVSD